MLNGEPSQRRHSRSQCPVHVIWRPASGPMQPKTYDLAVMPRLLARRMRWCLFAHTLDQR